MAFFVPKRYKVTIYNDDFTTMEFVVMILKVVFFKSEADAQTLMLQVHHADKAIVLTKCQTPCDIFLPQSYFYYRLSS